MVNGSLAFLSLKPVCSYSPLITDNSHHPCPVHSPAEVLCHSGKDGSSFSLNSAELCFFTVTGRHFKGCIFVLEAVYKSCSGAV